MESSLSVPVCQVDIAVAVNQQGHQTFELLFVSSPDVAVHGCIAIHVQYIVITHLHQQLFKILCMRCTDIIWQAMGVGYMMEAILYYINS